MTEIFDRGDCFYFERAEQFRGSCFVVIADYADEVRFASSIGRIFEAEVGDESLYVTELGGAIGVSVSIDEITFE